MPDMHDNKHFVNLTHIRVIYIYSITYYIDFQNLILKKS